LSRKSVAIAQGQRPVRSQPGAQPQVDVTSVRGLKARPIVQRTLDPGQRPTHTTAQQPRANGATYTSLGQRPRDTPEQGPFHSAEGRSEAAGETTKLPSSIPPTPPNHSHAKPLAVRAGLSSPRNHPKPPKPLSTLAIYISKTWHSYPYPLATIEIAPKSKRLPTASPLRPLPPKSLRKNTFTSKHSAMSGLQTIFQASGGIL
jgi:hypothetical protein